MLETGEATATSTDLLDYNRDDAENCNACTAVNDVCPYHRGVADGIAYLHRVIEAVVDEPELAHGALSDYRRIQQEEAERKAREDAGPYFVFGVAHPDAYTVPIRSLTVAEFTKDRLPSGAEIVVRLVGDDRWFRYEDGRPVEVREFPTSSEEAG